MRSIWRREISFRDACCSGLLGVPASRAAVWGNLASQGAFWVFLNWPFSEKENSRCSPIGAFPYLRIQSVLYKPFFIFKEQDLCSLFLDLFQKRIKDILIWAFFGIQEYMGSSQISELPKKEHIIFLYLKMSEIENTRCS